MAKFWVAVLVLMVAFVSATDPSAIMDLCVADLTSTLVFNGHVCKPPEMAMSEAFAYRGFRKDANTNNPLDISIIPSFAEVNYPALNMMSFVLAKFNYAKDGLVHPHPRVSEVITVTKGEVYVGFVDTVGKLYVVTLKKDDFFLFLQGLVHFQLNSSSGHAKTVSVLNAQNSGMQLMPSALFGSSPFILSKILAKAFGISVSQVDMIKKGFQPA